MKPSKLYEKDYLILSNDEANEKADYLKSVETIDIANIKSYSELSLAVRHNLSLFPNNLVVLQDEKDKCDLVSINSEFNALIHKEGVLEREVLNFINHAALQEKLKPLHADTKKLWAIHYNIYEVQHEQEHQQKKARNHNIDR